MKPLESKVVNKVQSPVKWKSHRLTIKRQPHKMIKHTSIPENIRCFLATYFTFNVKQID